MRHGPVSGLLVPWPQWRTAIATTAWADFPVPVIAIGVAVVGLLLLLVGRSPAGTTSRSTPRPEITVTTSPRVLARLVGRRVRAHDDIAAASVTASARRVTVVAEGWGDARQGAADDRGPEVDGAARRAATRPQAAGDRHRAASGRDRGDDPSPRRCSGAGPARRWPGRRRATAR